MNWNDYKEHVKACSEDDRRNMEEIEAAADIVSSLIKRRQAERCGIPQSSVARIESCSVAPKLDTLIKLMQALQLKLQVAVAS